EVAAKAAKMKMADAKLQWIDRCLETRDFIGYWFVNPQRRALRRLSAQLCSSVDRLPDHIRDCLWLALSRTIITKQYGATLAWDVSHSRPHKMRTDNDFEVFKHFVRAAGQISQVMAEERLRYSGTIRKGDCRMLPLKTSQRVDAVITSPPYLNAIDYL